MNPFMRMCWLSYDQEKPFWKCGIALQVRWTVTEKNPIAIDSNALYTWHLSILP